MRGERRRNRTQLLLWSTMHDSDLLMMRMTLHDVTRRYMALYIVTRPYTALHVVTQLSRDVTVTLPWRYKFDRGSKKKLRTYIPYGTYQSRILQLRNKIVNPQLRKSTAKFAVAQLLCYVFREKNHGLELFLEGRWGRISYHYHRMPARLTGFRVSTC